MDKKKLPELKSKPIIGVPEEDYDKWTTQYVSRLEALKEATRVNKIRAKSEEHRKNLSKSHHGKGRLYKELQSGFIGTLTEHIKEFQCFSADLSKPYLGKTKTRGKHKGRCWVEVASQD